MGACVDASKRSPTWIHQLRNLSAGTTRGIKPTSQCETAHSDCGDSASDGGEIVRLKGSVDIESSISRPN